MRNKMLDLIAKFSAQIDKAFDRIDAAFGWIVAAVSLGLIAASLFLTKYLGAFGLFVVAAGFVVIALVAVRITRAREKLGADRQETLQAVWEALVRAAIYGAMLIAIYRFWNVPEIWDRPLAALTLGEIAENVFKFGLLSLLGSAFLRSLFSE